MEDSSDYNRVRWAWVLGCFIVAAAVYPFDETIAGAMQSVGSGLGGDLRRELEAWGQYGQATWVVVIGTGFVLLSSWRWRRVLDLLVSAGLTWVVAFSLKILIGRPRPKFEDPWVILGPLGQYPVNPEAGVRHAWEIWAPISSDLWSMPSSHTAFAFMLSVFVGAMAPRLRPLVFTLAVIVGLSRVLLGAHYPSDVLVGAGIGYGCASMVVWQGLGVRLVDWVWVHLVDRKAEPAFEKLIEAERQGGPGH